jgi:hypothetical protein
MPLKLAPGGVADFFIMEIPGVASHGGHALQFASGDPSVVLTIDATPRVTTAAFEQVNGKTIPSGTVSLFSGKVAVKPDIPAEPVPLKPGTSPTYSASQAEKDQLITQIAQENATARNANLPQPQRDAAAQRAADARERLVEISQNPPPAAPPVRGPVDPNRPALGPNVVVITAHPTNADGSAHFALLTQYQLGVNCKPCRATMEEQWK